MSSYSSERHCARVFTVSGCLLVPPRAYMLYLVCTVLRVGAFDGLCVFGDSRGLQKVGRSVWELRGGVNERMKETRDNKPLE